MLKHKFHAVPKTYHGIKFASTKEANMYVALRTAQDRGAIVGFLRQVPFYFQSGQKYVCDFEIFETSGVVRFVDVKGMRTPTYKAKLKLLADEYPWVTIEEV